MKKLSYALLGFSVFVLILAVAALIYDDRVIQEQAFYASVNVTESGGFDLNGTALTFGSIAQHGSSTREINFQNNYDFPIFARITSEGEISSILHHDGFVRLKGKETKKVSFSVVSDENTERNFYEGEVIFKIIPA